jgi:hypothetical protein
MQQLQVRRAKQMRQAMATTAARLNPGMGFVENPTAPPTGYQPQTQTQMTLPPSS